LTDSGARDSLTFRKDSLDRLDYLFAALKKRGIYVMTDLFVSRPIRSSEAPGDGGDDFKMATLVSDQAMANWKAFSKELLDHANPYTKRAYKDDPALAWLSLVNEPNAVGFVGNLKGELRTLFEDRWRTWLKRRYESDARVAEAWEEPGATLDDPLPRSVERSAHGRDLALFLTQLHEAAYAEMSRFLKQEIGTKALLTYLNGWSETPAFMEARTHFDWVDNHFYWDHPEFLEKNWQLPTKGWSGGGSALDLAGAGPTNVAMTRLYGKPFSVSEFNYVAPNSYRAEGGLLIGAAAALQDWDALWRFAYSHSREALAEPVPIDYFNVAADPDTLASERAALLLFVRRDAKSAPHRAVAAASREDLVVHPKDSPFPNLSDLTWVAKVGVSVEPPSAGATEPGEVRVTAGSSANALNRLRRLSGFPSGNRTNLNAGIRESETGETYIDADRGEMIVRTPLTAGGIARAGDSIQAGPLTAKISGARAAIWASSLDGEPLEKSRRILIVHATDVQNSGEKFRSQEKIVLEDWGRLPYLARAGRAEVSLVHEKPTRLKAWRLDASGRRISPLPVTAKNVKIILPLSTRDPSGKATLYYELSTESE
jgi:hypothetical protein